MRANHGYEEPCESRGSARICNGLGVTGATRPTGMREIVSIAVHEAPSGKNRALLRGPDLVGVSGKNKLHISSGYDRLTAYPSVLPFSYHLCTPDTLVTVSPWITHPSSPYPALPHWNGSHGEGSRASSRNSCERAAVVVPDRHLTLLRSFF
jgi:hypothetical protein